MLITSQASSEFTYLPSSPPVSTSLAFDTTNTCFLFSALGLPAIIHRLWDALNFTRAGLIPRAGRLKKTDGSGEEYVDAIVFYKRFDAPNLGSSAQAELSSSTPI